jgi:hypothetical protein
MAGDEQRLSTKGTKEHEGREIKFNFSFFGFDADSWLEHGISPLSHYSGAEPACGFLPQRRRAVDPMRSSEQFFASWKRSDPHPNPPPEYRERGPEAKNLRQTPFAGLLRISSCPFVSFVDHFFLILLLIAGISVAPALAQDSWNLVSADFQSRPVTLIGMDESGVQIAGSGGAAQTVGWDNLLELDHIQPPAAAPAKSGGFALYLNGGDEIFGSPVSMADDTLTWQHSVLGKIEVPEDRMSAIVRVGQSAAGIDQPRKADIVRLLNGDVTTGVIQSLTDSAVVIRPADADSSAQIDIANVAAILLADSDPLAPPPGRAWRVWLDDGSSLRVPLATMQHGQLNVGFMPGHTAPIDPAAVASIEQTNGPVRWLTDLTPTQVVYHPFLGENFPPQFDHPVDDPSATIRAKFPPFRHGIGVHSYTKLTYAIPDGFAAFRTQFAVERISGSDMTKTDLSVRILLDGTVAQEFLHVHYGNVAAPVIIDVAGKKELSLEVDFGDDLSAQGRFVWLDPAFVRGK